MTVFRWILGVLAGFFAIGAVFGLALYIFFESQLWLERARRFRHWIFVLLLFWFNVEVWGRVVLTLWRWGK
jgi:hypothetical protein